MWMKLSAKQISVVPMETDIRMISIHEAKLAEMHCYYDTVHSFLLLMPLL